MTPRAKIETLLEFWLDVEIGLRDRLGEGGVIGMCRSWNHRSYRELRRLLRQLRVEDAVAYRHLAGRYRAPRRQVLLCPRCLAIQPATLPWKPGQVRRKRPAARVCQHDGRPIEMRPASIRDEPAWIAPRLVNCHPKTDDDACGTCAVCWLLKNFRRNALELPLDIAAVIERKDPKRRNAPVDAVWSRSATSVVARFGNPSSRRVA